MPVSKNRKKQKNKAMQYSQKLKSDRKKTQEALVKLYQENFMKQKMQYKQQITGEVVDTDDMDLGLDNINEQIISDDEFVINEMDVYDDVQNVDNSIEVTEEFNEEKPKKRDRKKQEV